MLLRRVIRALRLMRRVGRIREGRGFPTCLRIYLNGILCYRLTH